MIEKYETLKNDDIFNLFIFGKYDKNKIYFDLLLNDKPQYYLRRKELYVLINTIESNNEKNILIHSEFGNGKTLLIEGIKAIYAQKNINCYELIEESDDTQKELKKILRQTEKQIIIIDNYPQHKKILQHIASERSDNTILILTERTVVSTTNMERLLTILGCHPYTLTIDRIDEESITTLIDIFESNAFWRKLSGKSKDQKRKELFEKYQCSMANILLGVLRSKDIKDRLNAIYSELKDNSLHKKSSH